MATLTQVSITTRKGIRFSIYFIIFLIFARITFGVGNGIFRYFFPKPPPAATVLFNRLPALPFPAEGKNQNFQFTFETPQGDLPNLGTQAVVYYMPKKSVGLSSIDNAKKTASNMGFDGSTEEISETTYRFKNSRFPSHLDMNIITYSFSLNYDLAFDPSPLTFPPPNPSLAATAVTGFLGSGKLLPEDLNGPVINDFLKVEAQKLIPTISLSEANFTKVNLYRRAYNELPAVTPLKTQSNVWFIASGSSDKANQLISGQYHYFPIDESQSSTYPIKTTKQATEELQNGIGYIAQNGGTISGSRIIRDIYLAYYDSGVDMRFYQPVYVFEGDNGFAAYVPAVTTEYYGE